MNPQDRSLPTLPIPQDLWNPPSSSSSSNSTSPLPGQLKKNLDNGAPSSVWSGPRPPSTNNSINITNLESSFSTMQPYMNNTQPQQQMQQQIPQFNQQQMQLMEQLLQPQSIPTPPPSSAPTQQQYKNLLSSFEKPSPSPSPSPPSAPTPPQSVPLEVPGLQNQLTQMVMMQQKQLQQGNEELKTYLNTIEELRNEIHRVKVARQEEQLLIHRLAMQQQERNMQFQQNSRRSNNGYNGQQASYNNSHQNNNPYGHSNGYGVHHGGAHGGIHGTPYEKYNRHQSGSDASMRMQRQHGSHSGKPRSSPAQSSRNARCQIDIQALKNQTEIRTTVMVCNIPNRYTRSELMDELDAKETLVGTYNFLYLPIDFKNNCNLGYAFVNMRTTNHVLAMYETMQGSHWELSVRSSKICKLKWGRVQGKEALLGHFLGTMHLNDTPCGFKPVTIEIDESTGTTVVQEVV